MILTIASCQRLFLKGAKPLCHLGLWLLCFPAKVLGFSPPSCFLGFSPTAGCCWDGEPVYFLWHEFSSPVVKPTGAADAQACAGTECTKYPLLKDLALCTPVADVRAWRRSCFLQKSLFLMCIRDREAEKCVLLNLS